MSQCGNLYMFEPAHAGEKPICLPYPEPRCALVKSWWIIYTNLICNTQNVFIDQSKTKLVAYLIIEYLKQNYRRGNFFNIMNNYLRHSLEHFPVVHDDRKTDLFFVLNALNCGLWRPKSVTKQWTVNGVTGYMALCHAIKRAILEGFPLWSPEYYANINYHDTKIIFRSDNETMIPALTDRMNILHTIGNILLTKYQGTFQTCVISCNRNPHSLLHLLLKEFKPYQDTVIYEENEIHIGSKALVLLKDLAAHDIIGKHYINSTILADYRVPQVLYDLGVLKYSPNLIDRFTNNVDTPLLHGSKDELEIRCCSLVISDYLMEEVILLCEINVLEIPELKKITLPNIQILIDNFLYYYRCLKDKLLYDTVPFHYIRSMYY